MALISDTLCPAPEAFRTERDVDVKRGMNGTPKLALASDSQCGGIVLMAGGNGRRLAPLTDACPKPLIKVGPRPILETIVRNFAAQGFRDLWLSVNHLGAMIEDHFGNGSQWDVRIRYLRESTPLGTAGALSLIPQIPRRPLLVMNGDVLTDIDFRALLAFHRTSGAEATLCVREQEITVPYGVVEARGDCLREIIEKPAKTYFINGGIYVIEPQVLTSIAYNAAIDMPQILEQLVTEGAKVALHKVQGYWCDIGQKPDLDRANVEFSEYFA